jgi:lysophospholipase L1-like esterase
MRNVLIVGDSLAGGLPHISFPAVLEKMSTGYKFTVSSIGGDTVAGINARLKELVPQVDPDVVIIEGGGNDIGLPFIKLLGGGWKRMVEHVEKRGSISASDVAAFEDAYSKMLESIEREGRHIVVTTIGCIGEDLTNALNKLREEYNAAIRKVAKRHGAHIADVGKAFEEILAKLDMPSQYVLGKYRDAFLDTPRMLTVRGAYQLSGRRGLVLTIDGSHNNPCGARIYAETIYHALPG